MGKVPQRRYTMLSSLNEGKVWACALVSELDTVLSVSM